MDLSGTIQEMDLDLARMVLPVKRSMMEIAEKAARRRLTVFGSRITCTSGCAGCCRRQVYISVAEALSMLEYLEMQSLWGPIRDTCRQQLSIALRTNPESWFRLNIGCSVLAEDQSCQAYGVRPSACSTHFATSDPDVCGPWSPSDKKYEPVDFRDLHEEFLKTWESCVDGYGILAFRGPIPVMLLLAERVRHQRDLPFDTLLHILHNELL